MKMFRKGLAVLLLAFLVTGCSNDSFDVMEVVSKAEETMEQVTSYGTETKMIMDVKVSIEDESMSLLLDLSANTKSAFGDENITYNEVVVTAEAFGESSSENIEMYAVETNDTITTYSNDGLGWYDSTGFGTGLTDFEVVYSNLSASLESFNAKAAGKEEVNGIESYVIELTVDKDTIDEIGGEEIFDALGGLHVEGELEIPVRIYISTADYSMVGIHFDYKNFAEEIFKTSGIIPGVDEDDLSVEVNDFYMSIYANNYGEYDDLTIPQEVLDESNGGVDSEFTFEKVEGDVSTQTNLWTNAILYTGDGEITLGTTTLADLFALGFTDYFGEITPETVEIDSVSSIFIRDNTEIYISGDLYESSDSIQDTVLDYVSIDSYSIDVTLEGGIGYGSSQDDVIALYGEPNIYRIWNDGEIELEYQYDNIYLEISIYDGIVKDITIGIY